jgi:hypothetical protein
MFAAWTILWSAPLNSAKAGPLPDHLSHHFAAGLCLFDSDASKCTPENTPQSATDNDDDDSPGITSNFGTGLCSFDSDASKCTPENTPPSATDNDDFLGITSNFGTGFCLFDPQSCATGDPPVPTAFSIYRSGQRCPQRSRTTNMGGYAHRSAVSVRFITPCANAHAKWNRKPDRDGS